MRLNRMGRVWMAPACLAATICIGGYAQAQTDGCNGAEADLKTLNGELNRNALADAKSLLARLQTAHPDCAALLLANARILTVEGPPSAAGQAFSQYADRMPDEATGMAYFARFLIDQGQYAQADEFSQEAYMRAPESPAALAVRGQILVLKGQTAQGRELLEKSCALQPDDAEAEFQLGAVLDRAKRPAEAVTRFAKVVELDPNFASAWDYLALNLEPLGKEDQADAAYRHGLDVNHEGPHYDAFLDYNYGRFLAKRNQLDEAKKHLDRAVTLVPDYRATWYDRAKLNFRMGNYAQARTDGERALSITENTGGILNLQVYVLLEQVYRRLGEKELADKYAKLTRETPPPARKDYGDAPQP